VHYSIQDSDTGIIREFLAEGRENDVNWLHERKVW
jgi:hypothetical protein